MLLMMYISDHDTTSILEPGIPEVHDEEFL